MRIISIALLSVAFLTGCGKRVEVKQADASAVILPAKDRVQLVLDSNLPPENKTRLVQEILMREKEKGTNWREGVREFFAWGLAILGMTTK